ncbi:type II secretion system protein GspD [Tenacibaculum halocynthiae]|uniref:type II secretion system protein GspD n=1 Tax=Tenacibaculum halocynthiae TaxID=1254437 RepID=UPI003893F714
MLKKHTIKFILILFLGTLNGFTQENINKEKERIQKLEQKLNNLLTTIPGLTKTVDFNVSGQNLPVFIRAIGKARKVNLSVSDELQNTNLTHNFSNAQIKDILLYLCKEFKLTFIVTGNIISLKKHVPKKEKKPGYIPKNIPVEYDVTSDLFTVDLQNDSIAVAFKKITNISGKNLVFSSDIGRKTISGYIKNKSFESAMDKLAFSNNLIVTKTKDNYYLFENATSFQQNSNNRNSINNGQTIRPTRYQNSNLFFKIIDTEHLLLDVDFENAKIETVINDIGNALKINIFTNTPLNNIGKASVKASRITYDELLSKILEDTKFTYKKKKSIYYFGQKEKRIIRSSVVIPLMHRSIEIMNQPLQNRARNRVQNFNGNRNSLTNNSNNFNSSQQSYSNGNRNNFNNQRNNNYNSRQQNIRNPNQSFGNYNSKAEALKSIIPKDIIGKLEIITDIEQNAFIVSGDTQEVEKFKEFVSKIDKPIPVVLIEVMILEVTKSASVSTGLDLGIGDKPTKDNGSIFPSANINLGATTINKIIGGFNGFGSLNVGKVVPNFFAKIQMMETNGDVKIRSTPKLSTLNGHSASLSNGERSYYKDERTDVIGSQNPQTIQTNQYIPIDADLSVNIRPIVSGDEQITLSVNVLQSSFNGKRIDKNAPPGMNSREFTSTIRVQDQDVIILGGLEENIKNDSGSGVPFLARVPIIKWLFSKKTRTNSKTKLSVLIKPTIIR